MKHVWVALVFVIAAASGLGAAQAPSLEDLNEKVTECTRILEARMGRTGKAIPAVVLQRAKGILIVHQWKAGLILGVSEGYGVGLVRQPDGKWSPPAFYTMDSGSAGVQIGARTSSSVVILLKDSALEVLHRERWDFGVVGVVAAGPTGGNPPEHLLKNAAVLVYEEIESGAEVGLSLKTEILRTDNAANRVYYANAGISAPHVLFDQKFEVPENARKLVKMLNRYQPAKK